MMMKDIGSPVFMNMERWENSERKPLSINTRIVSDC
jgi:hypothetical protein